MCNCVSLTPGPAIETSAAHERGASSSDRLITSDESSGDSLRPPEGGPTVPAWHPDQGIVPAWRNAEVCSDSAPRKPKWLNYVKAMECADGYEGYPIMLNHWNV